MAGTQEWTAERIDSLGMKERHRVLGPLLRPGVEAYTPPGMHAPSAMTMLLRCDGDHLVTALTGYDVGRDFNLATLMGECVTALQAGADVPAHPGWEHLSRPRAGCARRLPPHRRPTCCSFACCAGIDRAPLRLQEEE